MGRVELNESVTMIRRILSVFFPIFASNSIGTVMLLIDRILIGHAGPQSLSAVVGAAWFLVFLQMFPNGILSYTTAMVANSRGAGRDADCSLICTQSCLVGIASYICLIALLPIEIRFFGIFGMDEAIVILEKQFFIICVLGSLFGLLGIALGGYFIGTKRPSNVTWSTLIAATTTILLDYVLIFGNLGFPKLGVKGAAIATTVGNLFATAWLLFLYLRKSNAEPFRVVDSFRFSPFLLKKLMKLGAPLGIEQVVYVGTSAVFFQLFFSYGKDAAAALSAVSSVDSVVFMPFLSMMITVMTLVGTEMGNGNAEKGRKYSLSALCVALVIAVVPASLYLVVPQWLVRTFYARGSIASTAILALAVPMFAFAVIKVFADASGLVFAGALRGAGDTLWVMKLSVTVNCVKLLCLWVFISVLRYQLMRSWLVYVVGVVLIALISLIRFVQGRWRTLAVLG